jgi:putative protease
VERLHALQSAVHGHTVNNPAAALDTLRPPRQPQAEPPRCDLHLLVRTPDQLDAAIDLAPASITLDYLDLYGLRPSIEKVKAAGLVARVASPRILKPGEARILNFLLSLNCQILVRATGMLHALQTRDHAGLIGDFSLNAANSLSAAEYLKLGLSRLRVWRAMPEPKISKSSPTSICPFSIPNTACSAAFSPPEPVTKIAADPAKSTASN